MRRLCVFTGSNAGTRPEYAEAAATLGRTLAARGVGLVYGGGHVGLMGIVADSCLKAGGEVIGVIPRFLMDLEVGHGALTDLRVVSTMHERKALMADLSDGFIALPGGIGTMEELFEVWTWGQLGEHEKPVALLDVAGYYDAMRTFIDHMVAEGFLRDHHRAMLMVETDATPLLDRLAAYEPPKQQKWVTPATR
ncbi:TIGR00730 family Rossman fold protein [Caenispirillum salinarum]|uniref:LOG family protein n=1 Tax=Caenispirillum salinarum TaxID=859058 RepID=UPI00384F2C49